MLKSIAFLPVLFLASQCFAWTFNVDSIRVRGGQQIDSGLTVGKNITCDSLFRNNDSGNASDFCRPYDSTQIVRILNLIQNQNQRLCLLWDHTEYFLIRFILEVRQSRDDSLMNNRAT